MQNLSHRTVPIADTPTEELRAWWEAASRAFGQPRASDESLAQWHAEVARDDWRLDGVFAPASAVGLGESTPVGTFASTRQSINTGGGHVEPALFITDVTVRTTHRRRGILNTMMTGALGRARDEGLALAALTVTEGGIYGRFGFGVATQATSVEVDTGPRFVLSQPLEPRVELVEAEASIALRRAVFDAFHARTRGSHARLAFHDALFAGTWDYEKGGPDPAVRSAVHLGADGRPDGVVSFAFDRDHDQLKVRDLLAVTPEAELGLWEFLASVDLVDKLVLRRFSPTSPLHWALTDPRRVRTTGVNDFTWLRVLDVPKALGVRHFDADGEATFEVVDPQGLAAGTWRVVVRDGRATVEPASEASVQVEVRALGSLYLGLVDARTLATAGQVSGPDADVAALAALFRTTEPPHNTSGF